MKGVKIKRHSGIYTLMAEQNINSTIDKVWEFFSNPKNLSKITPEKMKFEITSDQFVKMHDGQIISYKVNILPGIRSNWVSEISLTEDYKYFIDKQLFGPYKLWHHQHIFKVTKSGILMEDIISFKLPFGIFGRIIFPIIKKQLQGIFRFRTKIINEIFNNK